MHEFDIYLTKSNPLSLKIRKCGRKNFDEFCIKMQHFFAELEE